MAWTPRSDTGGGKWASYFRVIARRSTKSSAQQQAASPPTATLTATLSELGISAQGVLIVASPIAFGVLNQSLGILSATGSGGALLTGAGVNTLGILSSVAASQLRIAATVTKTLGGASVVSAATLRMGGSANITLGAVTLSASATAITAPVITQTSSAGASPLLFTATLNTSDTFAGYTFRVQVAANTSGNFTSTAQDILHTLTESDITSGDIDITSDGFVTPPGDYSLRCRIERDDGIVSPWSNTITGTITSATAQWAGSASSFDRGGGITITGTPRLTISAGSNSNYQYVRTTEAADPNQFVWEFTLGSVVSARLGMDGRDIDFTTYSGFPSGFDASEGFYLALGTASTEIWANAGALNSTLTNGALATGDIITVIGNKTTGLVKFKRTRSGTTVDLGSSSGYTINSMTAWYIYHGSTSGGNGTLNTGQSAFAYTMTGSEAAFG